MTETAEQAKVDTETGEVHEGQLVAPTQLQLYGGETFADLIAGADAVKGYRLVKDLAELVGIPFVIVGARFNPTGLTASGAFVSVEAVKADNEPVVFNDGSTGIYRQLVAYMAAKGICNPGDGPEEGPMGTTRYDRPLAQWKSPKNADVIGKDQGFNFRLICPRGLRVSDYDFEGKDVSTFYLG